jgi:lipopolysaccharide/colanic/teichoic acid biosynthesis glycosyltransferase
MFGKRLTSINGLALLESVVELAAALLVVLPGWRISAQHLGSFLQVRVDVPNAFVIGFLVLFWVYYLRPFGVARSEFRKTSGELFQALKEFSVGTVLLCAYLLLLRRPISGFAVALLFAFCVALRVIRLTLERWLESRDPQLVIILGSGRRAGKTWREIRTRFHSRVKVVGFVDDRSVREMSPDIADRYLGSIDDLNTLLFDNAVDKVIVALPMRSCYDGAQRAISIAEQAGVQVLCMQDAYTMTGRSTSSSNRNDVVFSELAPLQDRRAAEQAVKRCIDFLGALVSISLFLPVFLSIAAALKVARRGPVFVAENRLGYRRRVFRIYLFNLFGEKTPFVSALARFLRKASLDKLPLLFNILVGNMSLVGPRPMNVRDLNVLSKTALMRRFTVKPGLTGLWNVTEPASLGFEKSIETDFKYIDDWSLALDFHILFKTLSVVFTRTVPA